MDLEQLKAPFSGEDVRWRVGFTNDNGTRGSALAYVEARLVQQRLDDVVGLDGWASEITPILENGMVTGAKCRLTIFTENGEVWREDFGSATENEALKAAASDAFKRAAVQFGIGRYLYELPSTWVDLDNNGRFRETPELPDWALPEEERNLAQAQEEPEPERESTPRHRNHERPARPQRNSGYERPARAQPQARWRD